MSRQATWMRVGARFSIADAPSEPPAGATKEGSEASQPALQGRLESLQEALSAARTHSFLIVVQGVDASGKDGALRCLGHAMNPVDCGVVSFKVPSDLERRHDFLWRVHREAPARGKVVLFNRSHYEDVLVGCVHKAFKDEKSEVERHLQRIIQFEGLLNDAGTIILKLFLHVSKAEQKERLLAREGTAEKAWKLAPGDWEDRKLWSRFQDAYERVLRGTSVETAPWMLVPADKKWFRNEAVLKHAIAALEPFEAAWRKKMEWDRRVALAAIKRMGDKD